MKESAMKTEKKLQLIKELVRKNTQNPTICCRVRII
jgi:hypothetical protein